MRRRFRHAGSIAALLVWLVVLTVARETAAEPVRLVLHVEAAPAQSQALLAALRARIPGAEVLVDGTEPLARGWRVQVSSAEGAYDVALRGPDGASAARRITLDDRTQAGTLERAVAVFVCELVDGRLRPPGQRATSRRRALRGLASATRRDRHAIETATAAPEGTTSESAFRISLGASASALGSFAGADPGRSTAGGATLRLTGGLPDGPAGILRLSWGHAQGGRRGTDSIDLFPIAAGAGWRWRPATFLSLFPDLHLGVDAWSARGERTESGAEFGAGFGPVTGSDL